MKELQLQNKKIASEKLSAFGFEKKGERYFYAAPLLNGEFTLEIQVEGSKAFARLIENAFGEEYTLHLVQDAEGEFVGSVREAYRAAVENFVVQCCEDNIFKSRQTLEVIAYARETYGDELEFLWEKYPDCAVLRRKDSKLWYAVVMTVPRKKLGLESDEIVEILDLRVQPQELETLAGGTRYFRGYHMNKKSWLTVILDGSLENAELFSRLSNSHSLATKHK